MATYPLSMDIRQKATHSLKQQQRLIMSPQMQQAIHLLQMPVMELSTLLENELEQNPLIEIVPEGEVSDDPELAPYEHDVAEKTEETDAAPEKELSFNDHDFEVMKQLDDDFRDVLNDNSFRKTPSEEDKLHQYFESSIVSEESLFEHLMVQAQETFEKEERSFAEAIIGNLNEKGFLEVPLEEIAITAQCDSDRLKGILARIQTFDPYGVGGRDLKESLLIQLRCRKKEHSLAYRIIQEHYDDLLHNRLPLIKKALGCSLNQLTAAIDEDVASLDLHPGMWYSRRPVQYIKPDVLIKQEGEELVVEVMDDYLPPLRFNRRYMRMLEDPSLTMETRDFIKQKIVSAKWLLKNIHQRNETLKRIAQALCAKQKEYFLHPDGKLTPLTMKVLADELEVHESTIARAVANKYVDTPKGLLSLRSFFTVAYHSEEGEDISARTVKDVLKEIIDQENKKKPLSDNKISQMLKERGMDCARRTVAKYRAEMNIGNTPQRKQF
jgi:RNA polymerase sigma-54 factor